MITAKRVWVIFQILVLGGCAMGDRPPEVPYNAAREYRLGPGDQIRVVVFDQPALSSVYSVDASGRISMPLAGTLKAEDKTTQQIASSIRKTLREASLVEDPKVSVEVAFYRPFSIIGEVRGAGRYPYAPGMTLEDAVAAAGGYTIHADKEVIRVTTRVNGAQITDYRPPTATFLPGDTLYVRERWY
jgi:polysaccharide biosynthesis/export protein